MRDITVTLALVFCMLQACSTPKQPTRTHDSIATEKAPAQSEPMGFRYPQARWRMAMFDELDRATFWIGHIAIRHDQSSPDTFRPGMWRPDSPNPKRSVTEASALAEKVAARAAAAPDSFEQLARQYSDDIVSRDDGGMLGGVRASQLAGSGFLDVLAVLKPGEVSKPFRTPYGFHILKRYPPPPETQVAGERIVIGYQGVYTLINDSGRSRASALQLARSIADQARKGDQDFRTLVERYSENVDRARHGDLGVYSTRDPEYLPVEVHHLSQLEIGEVTGPVDSRFGFEILKRVPVTPRAEYAMTAIELPIDITTGDLEASRAQAQEQAEAMRRELEDTPERFEALQKKYCCERIRRWTAGRGDADLSRALDALSIGEIAPKPLFHENAYLVVRRLDPSSLPPEAPRLTELPNPSEPDYDALMKYNSGKNIAGATRAFVEAVQTSVEFTPEATSSISKMLDALATSLETHSDDRVAVRDNIYTTLAMLESELSADQFSRFKSFGRKWAVRQMMPPGSVD